MYEAAEQSSHAGVCEHCEPLLLEEDHATLVGLAQGRAVGGYVAAHALRPLHHGN